MTVKNNFNVLSWLSVIFVGAMLILGIVLLLKQILLDKTNILTARNTDSGSRLDIQQMPLPGFIPNQSDDSMDIHFTTPDGMVEDKAMAKSMGIYKVYRSADSKKVSPESFISISFCKKKDNKLGLKSFVVGNTRNIKKSFYGQEMTVGLLHLPGDVVKKFEDMGIPYQGMLFLVDTKSNQSICSCAIFFFETPAGFWSINWTAPKAMLMREGREKDIFLGLIKFMIIGISRPDTKTYEVHM